MMMTDWSATFITYLRWKWEECQALECFGTMMEIRDRPRLKRLNWLIVQTFPFAPFPLGPGGGGPVNPEMEMKLKIEMKTKI